MRSFALVPAAGASTRMGRPKLLLPWGSGSVIDAVLSAWTSSGVSRVVVVVRDDDRDLQDQCRRHPVELVVAAPPPADMKQSVGWGLDHVRRQFEPQPDDAWLLAPADAPRLTAQLINRLLAAHDPTRPAIVAPSWGQRRGHPILVPWPLAQAVDRLAPHEGIDRLLASHPVRTIAGDTDAVLDDLDTPDDYRRLAGRAP